MGFEFSAFRMISQFSGTHRFLSNFYEWDLTLGGIYMPTAEHAFQAAKTHSLDEKLWIADALTPEVAKRRGRIINLRSDWDQVKLAVMLQVVHFKFMPENRREMLKKTSPHYLSEGNYWHDQFWGNCMCSEHTEPGKNYLGKILMHVRKEL